MSIATIHDNGNFYTVTLADDTIICVPKDPLNADYVRVEAWIADGGTIS